MPEKPSRSKCPTCGYPFKEDLGFGQLAVEFHRAALVEVARRAIADCRNCDDPACEACVSEAEGVVTEYLAEQAEKEGE